MSAEEHLPVEQEREAVAPRVLVGIAVVAVVVVVLAVFVSDRLLGLDERKLLGATPRNTLPAARAPRVIGVVEQSLVSAPGVGLVQNEQGKLALGRYAWVDRAHGVVQIPIDRAISLYVAAESHSDAGALP